MLKFDKVTFTYPDGTIALKDINFEAEAGEFIFLTGPTGSGKTTMLKLILASLQPTKGKIIFDDKNINQLREWEKQLLRQKIGVVFQNKNLISELNIKENLYLRLELAGIKKEDQGDKLSQINHRFQLQDKLNYFPSQLSSGEKRKVALARALSLEPLMIFADEPTANLDPATSWEIMTELVKINKDGILVIVASHNDQIVNKFRYRVLSLNKGRLISDVRNGTYVSN